MCKIMLRLCEIKLYTYRLPFIVSATLLCGEPRQTHLASLSGGLMYMS